MPVNQSEQFVCDLCDRSFLEPWAYMNPLGTDGKELADALVSFGNSVILISVKEYSPQAGTDESIARDRWHRKAVQGTIKQLLGAHRRLARLNEIVEPSSGRRLFLPAPQSRRVYMVSIPLRGSRFGRVGSRATARGFVHILDDLSLAPHFSGLDTASDFLSYLTWRETQRQPNVAPVPAEEDWLAHYLLGRRCGTAPKPGEFREFLENSASERQAGLDEASLFWDRVILHVWNERYRFIATPGTVGKRVIPPPSEAMMEDILRQMSLHPRSERRALGAYLLDLFTLSTRASARVLKLPVGPGYVFQCRESFEDSAAAQEELIARCMYIQECVMPDRNVVGLASTPELGSFHRDVRIFLCYLEGAVGTEAMRDRVRNLAQEMGIFQELREYDVPRSLFGISPKDEQ